LAVPYLWRRLNLTREARRLLLPLRLRWARVRGRLAIQSHSVSSGRLAKCWDLLITSLLLSGMSKLRGQSSVGVYAKLLRRSNARLAILTRHLPGNLARNLARGGSRRRAEQARWLSGLWGRSKLAWCLIYWRCTGVASCLAAGGVAEVLLVLVSALSLPYSRLKGLLSYLLLTVVEQSLGKRW